MPLPTRARFASSSSPLHSIWARPRVPWTVGYPAVFCWGLLLCLLLPHPVEAGTRRYRLTWRDNPATSITVGFEHFDGSNVRVVYDTKDGGRNPRNYRYTAAPSRSVNYHEMRNVFVRLKGLQPATLYYFLVVDDKNISQRMIFETPH
ncbi:MAG: fibronectin type III domain-containing protein, partial [Bacteroidota bacterium]